MPDLKSDDLVTSNRSQVFRPYDFKRNRTWNAVALCNIAINYNTRTGQLTHNTSLSVRSKTTTIGHLGQCQS